jgi:outer membrane lipoprotein-sorting protein
MKKKINTLMFFSFLVAGLIFPAFASVSRAEQLASQILSHLYGAFSAPTVQDFSADFYSKVNPSPQFVVTNHEDDLNPFSKGRVFFKKPYFLRVESTLLGPGLAGEEFVLIRTGKFIFAYKNGIDIPIAESLDDPTQPSQLLPFGLQLPIPTRYLQTTLIGETDSFGEKNYILGLLDRTDPDHDILKVWVDEKHHFVRRAEWYELRQKKSSIQIASSDGAIPVYKKIVIKVTALYEDPLQLPNGYWIPMRIERYENWSKNLKGLGSLAQVVVYSHASVNSGLPDALFQPPKPTVPYSVPLSNYPKWGIP